MYTVIKGQISVVFYRKQELSISLTVNEIGIDEQSSATEELNPNDRNLRSSNICSNCLAAMSASARIPSMGLLIWPSSPKRKITPKGVSSDNQIQAQRSVIKCVELLLSLHR